MKINWRQKLSSRKFWAMLGGQITSALAALNAGDSVVMKISAVIGSIGTLAVFMLAEAKVDANRNIGEGDGND